jgi:transposase InsO family protein
VKFDFIAAEDANTPRNVAFMCRMLDVSRSGYYAHLSQPMSARAREDFELVPLIHAEFRKHPRGCGSRMVHGALQAQGIHISRKRVVRLMAEEGLRCRLKRRFARTTISGPGRQVSKNVLRRRFAVGKRNVKWAGDITYLHTKRGWAYLAVVLDLGTRQVIGWNVATTLDEQLAVRALEMALRERRPPRKLVHHSDRGVQYTSFTYQQLLAKHGVVCSMSRKGNCWDNACVESFFSTLKRELPNDHVFDDAADVERYAFEYIDAYYNTKRPHSALGYRTPNDYERLAA